MVDNRVTSHCYCHLACNACRFSIKCITGVTSSCNNKLANNGTQSPILINLLYLKQRSCTLRKLCLVSRPTYKDGVFLLPPNMGSS